MVATTISSSKAFLIRIGSSTGETCLSLAIPGLGEWDLRGCLKDRDADLCRQPVPDSSDDLPRKGVVTGGENNDILGIVSFPDFAILGGSEQDSAFQPLDHLLMTRKSSVLELQRRNSNQFVEYVYLTTSLIS